jgi:alcohol dehydrogenase YqhD (iron-dependent ADH family)
MTCHGIEHAISGYYDINHGAGLAALLPAWMKQIYPARKERFLLLSKNVFGKAMD